MRTANRQTAAAVVPVVAELLESRKMLAAGISGAVYVDADNDAKLDTGEAGIANVTLTLTGTTTAGAKVTKTAKTNASGRFLFDGLAAGVYKVVETQPSNYLDGKDATGFTKAVIGNDVISNIILGASGTCFVTFGERPKPVTPPPPPPPPPPGVISGFTYDDKDNDGVKETGEAGIAGVKITLTGTTTSGQSVNLTTATSTSGFYEFKGLLAGTYTVTETQPTAYIDGKDTAGSLGATVGNDVLSVIRLAAGQTGANYNFGELTPSCIQGFVFVDLDRDNVFDTNEQPLANVLITLTGTNSLGQAVTLTTRTDAKGSYQFIGLRAGTYTITETQPTGVLNGRSIVGSAGGVAGTNLFSQVQIGQGICVTNYNFSEFLSCGCPPTGGGGSDGHSDGKSDGGSDGKSDGGSDGKSDGGSDGKSDGGSDGKSDGGSDGKSDGGSDGKSDGGSDGKSDGGSDGKSDGGSDGKSDGGSDGKSDGGSDGKSDGGSDGKSDGGSDGKSDGGSDGKSDGGSDGKSDGGSDGKSDGGSDGKSDGGSDGKSDGGSDGGYDYKKKKTGKPGKKK